MLKYMRRDVLLDIPVPDVDKQCRLLGPTALVVQSLMGVLVIASLLYKRYRESPQRAWKIWTFDISKQIVGQAILHGSNVLISAQVAHRSLKNPCVTYFLNILFDTTLGVGIIYGLLHLFTFILSAKAQLRGFESGVYGEPPSIVAWAKQAVVYVVSLVLMKLCVIGLLALVPWFTTAGRWLLGWTGNRNALQVIFVMGIFPIGMNILQFWLIDSIVKFKSKGTKLSAADREDSADAADVEPLFNGHDEDDRSSSGEEGVDDLERGPRTARTPLPNAASPQFKARRAHPSVDHIITAPSNRGSSHGDPEETSLSPSSDRTIKIRRRSPPSTPSPTPSYGSVGQDGGLSSPQAVWGWDDDPRVRLTRSLSAERGGYDDDQATPRSSVDVRGSVVNSRKWESWQMPSLVNKD